MTKYNRVYNFSAGPSMLPLEVLEKVKEDLLNYQGSGQSQKEPDKHAELKEEICAIVTENKGRYGYRRVTQELRNRGLHPSEIVEAYEAGADAVKVFPVGNLGPSYIKAIKAPLSHIPLMAVGGVNEKNAAGFLAAGCCGIGVGGNLVNKSWIEAGEWDKITELAQAYRKAVDEA